MAMRCYQALNETRMDEDMMDEIDITENTANDSRCRLWFGIVLLALRARHLAFTDDFTVVTAC